VSHHTGESFFDELLGDVAAKYKLGQTSRQRLENPRILASDTDGHRFTLPILAFARADEVDVDFDILANQLFPEEFTSLLSVVGLL
jgi:hypothetical protein